MKNSLRFPHLLDCEILNDLSDDQKADFLNQFAVRTYTSKTPIIHQGQAAEGMHLVSHGSVEVSYLSEEGFQTIIFHAGPSAPLGVIESLAAKPVAATCVAMNNTCILFCPTPLLYQQMQSPVMIRNIAKLAYSTFERDNISKSIDQHYTVEQRICSHLWQLSEQTAEVRQSQSYLATMVGCSRQTVNKELGVLRDSDIIMLGKGKFTVLDRKALADRIKALTQLHG
jgi:CRP/FNR family cyclic AMP-dependent transcriptional regulator